MKALVVFESFFGNTEQVARAMAEVLGGAAQRVNEVRPEQVSGLELLVVGSATRAFRPAPETQAFLRRLPAGSLDGIKVAGFDTRIGEADMPGFLRLLARTFGYAAKPILKQLEKKGGRAVAEPEGFLVKGREGPLAAGELDRAGAWARELARLV